MKARTWVLTFGILVVSLLATLIVIDVALHFTHYRSLLPAYRVIPGYYVTSEDQIRDIVPNYPAYTVPLYDHPYTVWSNDLGCFDDPYRGERPYIYLTGDSFVWGFAPFEAKWGTLLQSTIGIRIVKCGVSGYGTTQELMKAREELAKLPDPSLVLVQYMHNDIEDDHDRAEAATTACIPGSSNRALAHRLRCALYAPNWLEQHSVLYNMMLYALPAIWPEFTPVTEKDTIANIQTLMTFNTLAESHAAKLVLVIAPYEYELSTTPLADPNREVKGFLASSSIPFVDITIPFRIAYDRTKIPLYWPNDPHWNIEGNQLASLLVSRYLIGNGFVQVKNASSTIEEIDASLLHFGLTPNDLK